MLCNVKGIVIRCSDYGENDKLLTLFTHEKGKMVVCVKGGRSIKCKHMPSCELFSYSEFALYEKQGKYWVRESYLCESFFRIRRELETMYLGQYLCDVACEFALFDMQDEPMLRLLLNSLFLLCSDKKDRRIVKSAFELKACSIEGFLPDITECCVCSESSDGGYFDAIAGHLICHRCKNKLNESSSEFSEDAVSPVLMLDKTMLDTMNFVISSPIEKTFAFNLPEDELERFCEICELYLLHQMERGFKTLDFYKSLLK